LSAKLFLTLSGKLDTKVHLGFLKLISAYNVAV